MEREKLAELMNKISIAQGEAQRALIWLKRFYDDLEILKKELFKDVIDDQG